MSTNNISEFFKSKVYAVVGASDDTSKYGYKCFACYLNHGYKAYPVNPKAQTILGHETYANLSSLPEPVDSISIITPPPVTEKVVDDAIKAKVKNIWMQPGAESAAAVRKAEEAGLNVIWGGPCLLVVLNTGQN